MLFASPLNNGTEKCTFRIVVILAGKLRKFYFVAVATAVKSYCLLQCQTRHNFCFQKQKSNGGQFRSIAWARIYAQS